MLAVRDKGLTAERKDGEGQTLSKRYSFGLDKWLLKAVEAWHLGLARRVSHLLRASCAHGSGLHSLHLRRGGKSQHPLNVPFYQ